MEKHFAVAIDGPAGAGKSSMAKAAARRFGFVYVDTGAIYRTVGLAALRAGLNCRDAAAVTALLPRLTIRFGHENGEQRMYLNGEDVTELIRTPEISRAASDVSAIPEVRGFLLDMQRECARCASVVMDGRDIGTVVLPEAELKIFLTASAERRAERRLAELLERGHSVTLAEVLEDMEKRDRQDEQRAAAPLRASEDAVLLDTSELTLDESIDAVCGLISERLGG